MVDYFASAGAFKKNVAMEYGRNGERYTFLKWGQGAFDNFRVVPPGTGICHQVNLEYLAKTVWTRTDKIKGKSVTTAYPDTLVGTDSHTTMINGLAVLGWGVGGIEAEAAMLGQPISMLIPEVIGFRLDGKLPEGTTATDLVLTVTQMLRKKGVVGKFVEFYGPGLGTPGAGRHGHHCQHGAGIWRDLRLLPGECRDDFLPQGHGKACGASGSRGKIRQGAGDVLDAEVQPIRISPTRLGLIWQRWCLRWQARSGPRTR